MNEILIWIPVILLHELGHWIAYRLYGFKPDIKLKWYGILLGNNCYKYTKVKAAFFINLAGIFLGYVPLLILDVPDTWILFYLLLCCMDIVNIMQLWEAPKEHWNLTLREVAIIQLKELVGED